MTRAKGRALAAAVLLFSAAADAWAGSTKQKVKATGEVVLRSEPPAKPFYREGSPVGRIAKDTICSVEEEREIRTLRGTYRWLRLECPKVGQGWAYDGTDQGRRYLEPVAE